MIPAYFPFSHISETTAEKIYNVFGKTIVYNPINAPVSLSALDADKKEMIEFRFPLEKYEKEITAAFREYGEWAKNNRGTRGIDAQFFRNRKETIPFFGETSISKIRNDIIKRGKGIKKDKIGEILFGAGLFSAVAKKLDSGNEDLESNLENFASIEKEFMESLNVDEKPAFSKGWQDGFLEKSDPGAHMTPERIRAWSAMMLADDKKPDFFITTSRAVVQYLKDAETDETAVIRKVVQFETGKDENGKCRFFSEIAETIKRLAGTKDIAGETINTATDGPRASGKKRKAMILYAVPGISPVSYFYRLAPGVSDEKDINTFCRINNTIICLLDI